MVMNVLKKIDAWVMGFVPPVVTAGVRDYPGFSIATAVAIMVFGDVVFAKIGSML
jgi:hypothetical protein